MEIKKSTSFRAPVRLTANSDGGGITGLVYSQVTVYLQKQDETSAAQKVLSSATDLREIDATNMPGLYDLQLSSSDTDVTGTLRYSVKTNTGTASNLYLGLIDVAEYIASDINTKLGTPAGASVSADIATRAPSATALSNATWTDAKAGYIDVAITSRAAASTALDNTVWTNTKAGYLDAAISSRSTYAGGPVASVTGDVGGNVLGSVGYVTGNINGNLLGTIAAVESVGYITGNINGNILGSVASLGTQAKTDVSTSVWSAGTRSLTTFGTLVTDTATGIWDYALSSISSAGSVGKLIKDNVDVTVSSRAPSATALSNATWTDTKAGYLDAAITSRSTYAGGPVASVAGDVGGSVLGSVGYVTGNINGNVLGSIGSLAAQAQTDASTAVWSAGTRTLTSFGTLLADIWDRSTSLLVTVGSVGKLLTDNVNATISSRAPSATALSNATWTDAKAGYLDKSVSEVSSSISSVNTKIGAPNSTISGDIAAVNALTARTLGLLHENAYLDQHVFQDGDPSRLTSARLRVYDSAANASTHGATGLLRTYLISATYDVNGLQTSYTLVQQ